MIVVLSLSFFFFKQKTAYEMRISDWSSDVCSSDLYHGDFVMHPCGFECKHILIAHFNRRVKEDIEVWCMEGIRFGCDGFETSRYVRPIRVGDNRYVHRVVEHSIDVHEIGRAHVCTPVTNAHLV